MLGKICLIYASGCKLFLKSFFVLISNLKSKLQNLCHVFRYWHFYFSKQDCVLTNKLISNLGNFLDCGINSEKKNNIKELFDLIPANRREFYNNIKTNDFVVDLIDSQ